MKKFAIGLFFILISWTDAPFINSGIDIIPSFIGYGIILLSVRQFRKKSHHLNELYLICGFLFLFSLFQFLYSIFGTRSLSPLIENAIVIISLLGAFFTSYKIVWGVQEVEVLEKLHLRTDALYSLWFYMLILTAASLIVPGDLVKQVITISLLIVKLLLIYNMSLTAIKYERNKDIV